MDLPHSGRRQEGEIVVETIAGVMPVERTVAYRKLTRADGEMLDRALVDFFAGPNSSTGEDVSEFQGHRGSAVGQGYREEITMLSGCTVAGTEEIPEWYYRGSCGYAGPVHQGQFNLADTRHTRLAIGTTNTGARAVLGINCCMLLHRIYAIEGRSTLPNALSMAPSQVPKKGGLCWTY